MFHAHGIDTIWRDGFHQPSLAGGFVLRQSPSADAVPVGLRNLPVTAAVSRLYYLARPEAVRDEIISTGRNHNSELCYHKIGIVASAVRL